MTRPYRPRKGWPYSSAGLSNDPILWLIGGICLAYVIFATLIVLGVHYWLVILGAITCGALLSGIVTAVLNRRNARRRDR